MSDFVEIDQMTLYQYNMRVKAHQLRKVDGERDIYLQAWANREVKATKEQGKGRRVLVYKDFNKFFNHEKYVNQILEKGIEDPKSLAIVEIMKRQKERREATGG